MSNIDKHALRDIAAAAVSTPSWHAVGVFGEVVDPANPEWKPVHDFCKTFTAERVLALLDELEAKDKQIAELEAREVELPPLVDCSNVPFAAYSWNAYRAEAVKALRSAGITVKGDSE